VTAAQRSFLDHPGPIAFAHRGGSEEAPENTMPAFEAAVALGYRYIETDVHMTADGALVAFHDASLDRVTDSRGQIAKLPLAAIREADAGYWFTDDGGTTFPFRGGGVQVPTLEEVLTRWPDVRVNIDPKDDVCVGPLAALLQRLDAHDRVCIGSFSDRRLLRVRGLTQRRVCTSMGRNAVTMAWTLALAGRMARLDADCVQVPTQWRDFNLVTAGFVKAAHRAGLPIHVWTVNDEATMRELLDLGIDGIMTDRPRTLRSVLLDRGQWPGPAPES
jgi:glycerophosphoryl diester phosphodiesterase